MTKFIFDLDATITKEETLPLIAEHFNVQYEIGELTKQTMAGNIPFMESFIKRVHILGGLPIDDISVLLSNIELYSEVLNFIHKNREHCVIATGNLRCWIEGLVKKIGCEYYCSESDNENNAVKRLNKVLHKEEIVMFYKQQKEKVVFIGDGNNDVEAMRLADVSVASGMTHTPAHGVLSVADYLVMNEEALCRLLNQLL